MGDPPLFVGGVHDTVTLPSPGWTVIPVGGSDFVNGVTGDEGALDVEAPARLLATTVKVYGDPFDRPTTVQPVVEPSVEVQVAPPGCAVMV